MDTNQIRYAFELMKEPDELIEVRVIQKNGKNISGYFKSVDKLIPLVTKYDNENIYFVMNKISDACYSRDQRDRMVESPKIATSDNDIQTRTWFLIDIDCKRAAGVSSTNSEKEESKKIANKVFSYLRDFGFSSPIVCDSGNGVHLLYKINMQNDEASKLRLKTTLELLDMYFTTHDVEVDKTVYNAARITKLYGTFSRKGTSTEERPHRTSFIKVAPDKIIVTPTELFDRLITQYPKSEKPTFKNNYGNDDFDLDSFILKNNINITNTINFGQGTKYILNHCLFNDQHKGKDAAIFKLLNGAVAYKCLHSSCSSRKWQDVRLMYEPNAYERKVDNFRNVRQTKPIPTKPQDEVSEKGNKFVQLHEIENTDRSNIVSIPSMFKLLDKKIIGFNKGEISLWSGKNGSAKSTILNQVALNACNNGFKVLLFSGELTPQRVKNWVHLQSAGRQFTLPTEYENLFYVSSSIGNKIDLWLKDKLFVYNNKYGNEYNQLLLDIDECVAKNNIDMVILDNVMAIDYDDLSFDKNNAQKKVFLGLHKLAEIKNIHIHIVAHPRKSITFLRKTDISGSADMTNIVENVFICHRNNNDFHKSISEFLGAAFANSMEDFSNYIEVCKNRDLGVEDHFVGLHYEKSSKRLLNEMYENIVYGWQDIIPVTNINTEYVSSKIPIIDEESYYLPDNKNIPF
jgi:archaellum biogenesis ATPase FlaH